MRGSIWLFEQPQSLGFSNVTTNVRMTVVKLASGGLWVHAPVAPTPECLRLLKVRPLAPRPGPAAAPRREPPLGAWARQPTRALPPVPPAPPPQELGAPVEFIVLPTFAYEHKIFVGPFSRRFPKAKVYVAPQ